MKAFDFTAKDLSIGDLVATWHLTVTDIRFLDKEIWGKPLIQVHGTNWNTNLEREYIVQNDKVLEVWE